MLDKVVDPIHGAVGTMIASSGLGTVLAAWSNPELSEVIAGVGLLAAGIGLVVRVIVKLSTERNTVVQSMQHHTESLAKIEKAIESNAREQQKRWEELDRRFDNVTDRVARLETRCDMNHGQGS